MSALEHLRGGDPDAALALLQEQVRKAPGDPKLRIFLFQLLCIRGEWKRAVTQLKVCAELEPAAEAMARAYREVIICEIYREKVFSGDKAPLVFGEPEVWLAQMIEALKAGLSGHAAAASELRAQALELAPAAAGRADESSFSWISDADSRFGPLLEIILNGKYYWMPFTALKSLRFEPPADLRDAVWTPVQVTLAVGSELAGFIPTRYPGTVAQGSGAERLARATRWEPLGGEDYAGLGQRVFATDGGDLALMDLRSLHLEASHG